jgi:hypothetical protein
VKIPVTELVISVRILTATFAIITVNKIDKSMIPICELISIRDVPEEV